MNLASVWVLAINYKSQEQRPCTAFWSFSSGTMEPAFSDLKSAVTNKGNSSALLDSEKTPPTSEQKYKTSLLQLECRRWRSREILAFLQYLLKYPSITHVFHFSHSWTQKYFVTIFMQGDDMKSTDVQMNSSELLLLWGDLQAVTENTQTHIAIATLTQIYICRKVHSPRDSFKSSLKVSACQWESRHNPMRWRRPMHHTLHELLDTWGWNKWWEIVCEKSNIWLKPSRTQENRSIHKNTSSSYDNAHQLGNTELTACPDELGNLC